jgi:hypothetical protein
LGIGEKGRGTAPTQTVAPLEAQMLKR